MRVKVLDPRLRGDDELISASLSVRDWGHQNGDWLDLLADFLVMRYIRICI